MTTSIVNYIIDKYLANVLEIDTNQTNASILKGEVELHNVRFKPGIFSMVNLPYMELVNGYIGTLKIKLSMPRFYLYPIYVTVDKVFIHARQKLFDKLNIKEEIEGMEMFKKNLLQTIEELSAEIDTLKDEDKGIGKQILKNLEVHIKDVVFRLDDNISYTNIPYSLGVILKNVNVKTTNGEEGTVEVSTKGKKGESDISHKQITIEDFTIFMDCYEAKKAIDYTTQINPGITTESIDTKVVKFLSQNDIVYYKYCQSELDSYSPSASYIINHDYLLFRFNMQFHLSLNDNMKNDKPKLYFNILFPNISLSLSMKQIEAINAVISYVNLIQLYRTGIANDFYTKTLSKEDKDAYLNTYLTYYLKRYVKKNPKEVMPKILLDYEKGLSYDAIQSMRLAAFIKMEYQNSIGVIDAKISQSKGRWLKRGLSKKSIEELNRQRDELINNENNVYNNIEKQLNNKGKAKVRVDKYPELRSDYVMYHFKFSITVLAFNLIDTPNIKNNETSKEKKTIVNVFFKNFNSEVNICKQAKLFTFRLGDINVTQQIISSKLYPYLIQSSNSNDDNSHIFLLEYEDNPTLPNADYRLKIRNDKQINIILNLYLINYLSRSLYNIIGNTINFKQIQSYAKGEAQKYIEAGYVDQFFKGDIQRESIDLDIILTSSLITIPQNIHEEANCSSIVMSTGDLTIQSQLAGRQVNTENYQTIINPMLLYDKYIICLTKIQMKTVSKDSESLLIKDYGISSEIALLNEPRNVMFDNVTIAVSMSDVDVYLDEEQLDYFAMFMHYTVKDNQLLKKGFAKGYERFVKQFAENKKMKLKMEKSTSKGVDLNHKEEKKKMNEESNEDSEGKATRKKIAFDFNLSKVVVNLMKMTSNEERAFSNDNSRRKEYLKFVLNTFNIQASLGNNDDINLQLQIVNFFLFDYDHIITSSSSISPIVNKDFQCIISTTDFLKANQSFNDNSYQASFIEVIFNASSISSKAKQTRQLTISLNKLIICPNVISMTRLNKFIMFYIEMFNDKLMELTEEEQNYLTEQSINFDYKKYDEIKKIAKAKEQGINPVFFNKVKTNMKDDKKEEKKKEDKKENKNHHQDEQGLISKGLHKERITVAFTMKDIELLMPINPSSATSPLLDFKLNLSMKFKQKNHINKLYSIQSNVLRRENYLIRNINMTCMIYNISFNMIQFTENHTILPLSLFSNLLSTFRLTALFKSSLLLSSESIISELQITLDPIILNLGFNELKSMHQLTLLTLDSIKDMNKPYYPNHHQDQSLLNCDVFTKGINIGMKAFVKSHPDSAHSKALHIKKMQSEFDMEMIKLKRKIERDKMYNIATFNEYNDLKVIFDKGSINIHNDGKKALAEISIADIAINYIRNSDPIDSINMGNALVEMISGREVPLSEFNINNLHQYLDITSRFEVKYYNDSLRKYEPFIEPWNITVSMTQVASITRRRMDIMSNMLNINCSSSSIKFFNLFLGKFLSNDSEKMVGDDRIDNDESIIDKDVIVEFDNKTGIPLVYWFDSNPKNMITIGEYECHSYTKKSLSEIIGKDGEVNHLQRDKFSCRVDKESYVIEGVDYSFNQQMNVNVEIEKKKGMITMKIMTIKTKKKIVFESGIEIVNGTDYDGIIISSGEDTIILDKKEKRTVPLGWIANKQEVFMQLNKREKKVMMYDHMSPFPEDKKILRAKTSKVIANDKESNQGKSAISNIANAPEKDYCRTLMFNDSTTNQKIYFALDYIALSPKVDMTNTNDLPSTKTNSPTPQENTPQTDNNDTSKSLSKPLNYIITITPPLILENHIPYELSYTQILNTNINLTNSLKPLSKHPIYSMFPNSSQSLLTLSLKYNQTTYTSLTLHPSNLTGIILFSSKDSQSIKCNLITHSPTPFHSSLLSSVISSKSSSQSILFTINYIITSRLCNPVYLKPSDAETSIDNQPYTIKPKSLTLISTNTTRISMKSDISEWSLPFNINTHGIDGVVSLEQVNTSQFKPKQKEASDVAVIISSLTDYPHTTVVLLEPRYLLINSLGFDIDYRQKDQDKKYHLPNEQTEELVYRHNERNFCIGINDRYSTFFNVDDIESFDLQVPITKEDITNGVYKGITYTPDDNKYYLLVRAILQSYDNGLIYIMFTLPTHPFLEVDNMTDKNITIKEAEYTSHSILPQRKVPFIWNDTLSITRTLKCCFEGIEQLFSFSRFDKMIIATQKEDCYGEKIKYQITVTNDNQSNTRTLRIQKIDSHLSKFNAVQKVLLGHKMPKITKYNALIEGIGISIIDDFPKEIFYVSFYGIEVKYSNNILKNEDVIENTMNMICYMKNLQIDYCLNDSFHNVLAPKAQILPCNEERLIIEAKENNTFVFPFIQLLICKQTVTNLTNDDTIIKYPQVDLTIQEFNVKIEQYAVMNLIHLFQFYMSMIDFHTIIHSSSIISNEGNNINNDPMLQCNIVIPKDNLIKETEDCKGMLMMNYLLLSAIKINLTLRVDMSQFDISLIPAFITQIIGTVGNTLTRITDSPLCFKETVYENVFIDIERITALLIEYYKNQAIRQIYKLLGSNDLIGNPIKLVENIGTGFSEFFNEPRKGFLKGPTQFGKGLSKGVTSLVSHVLGGGFGAVSSTSGTLLSAAQNLQNSTTISDPSTNPKERKFEENEPDNVIIGVVDGLKGGCDELGKGVSGVFMNPYRNGKTEGVKGVFKGIGSGLLGALISPFTAVLTFITSVSDGMKNSFTLSKNRLKTIRFRYPRVITNNEPLQSYDPILSEMHEMMLVHSKSLTNPERQRLIFYADYQSPIKGIMNTVILTNKRLIVLHDAKTILFKINVSKVQKCEVHIKNIYIDKEKCVLLFIKNNATRKGIEIKGQNICYEIYNIFKNINKTI